MNTTSSKLAAHYYEMAKQICAIADRMGEGDRREMMRRVAQNYERIATATEAANQGQIEPD